MAHQAPPNPVFRFEVTEHRPSTKGLVRCLALAVLTVATIGLYPATSWSLKNQLDALTGSMGDIAWDRHLDMSAIQDAGPGPEFFPPQLGGPRGDPLMDAIFAAKLSDETGNSHTRLDRLVAYCRAHPDEPAQWAHLARLASLAYWIEYQPPLADTPMRPIPSPALEFFGKENDLALEATANGIRLEPKNAYFHILRALALQSSGDIARMQVAWAAAARCERYDNHLLHEARLRLVTGYRIVGYRGEYSKWLNAAAVQLPYTRHVDNLVREFPWKLQGVRELELRRNMLFGFRWMLHSNCELEVSKAASAVRLAATRVFPPKPAKGERRTRAYYEQWYEGQAAALDEDLTRAGLASGSSAESIVREGHRRYQQWYDAWRSIELDYYGPSFGTATAWLCVLFSLTALFLGGMLRVAKWPPKARSWWLDLIQIVLVTLAAICAAGIFMRWPSLVHLAYLLLGMLGLGFVAAIGPKRLSIGGGVFLMIATSIYVVAVIWDVREDRAYAAATKLLMSGKPEIR